MFLQIFDTFRSLNKTIERTKFKRFTVIVTIRND